MKQGIFRITSNKKIARDIFKMTLAGDTSAITAPGQFVNIKLDGFFLRRPISVCDCVGDNLTLIYKTVGRGTEQMSRMTAGDELDLLTGLGNGYNTKTSGGSPLLVGGGVGVPPMYMLCKKLVAEGKKSLSCSVSTQKMMCSMRTNFVRSAPIYIYQPPTALTAQRALSRTL